MVAPRSQRGGNCGTPAVACAFVLGIIVTLLIVGPGSRTYNMDTLLLSSGTGTKSMAVSSSSSSSSCNPVTSKVFSDRLVIDFKEVRSMSKDRLAELKQFTIQKYEKFVMAKPGREHYTLLEYLVKKFGPKEIQPCADRVHRRHIVDIGTRYVASALALGASHGVVVKTFDLPESQERQHAFRGKSEADWQKAVTDSGVNIEFHNQNLLDVSDDEFAAYTATWFISLDTHHLPYTVPFEREFFARLAKSGYKGILVLDDIHLNEEMKKWWSELKENADSMGYRCIVLTAVGHFSGTGLVDFSGKVDVVQ